MKILVTGAKGQLGNELKESAKSKNEWDFLFTDIDELDLTKKEKVNEFFIKYCPEYVINCAAYTAVDMAEKETEKAQLINAVAPKILAEACSNFNSRLIHISTDYVYSGKNSIPIDELENTNPKSVYGKSKLEGEQAVLKHTNAIIIRTSWLYSRFGNNFVKSIIKLGKEREKLGIVFDQTGTPTSAIDLAKAILEIIAFSKKNNNWNAGIYNYSNEGVCSWYDFAYTIMNIAGIKCNVQPIETFEYPLPAPRPAYSVMNKKKIKTTFDILIPHWTDSLKQVVDQLDNY